MAKNTRGVRMMSMKRSWVARKEGSVILDHLKSNRRARARMLASRTAGPSTATKRILVRCRFSCMRSVRGARNGLRGATVPSIPRARGVTTIYRRINALSTRTRARQDYFAECPLRMQDRKRVSGTRRPGQGPDRLEDQDKIVCHARPVDVLQVHSKLFRQDCLEVEGFSPLRSNGAEQRLLVPEQDAGRVGQPGPRLQNPALLHGVAGNVARHLRARPDQGHFPPEHVDELWELVQLRGAKEPTDPGHAR